VIIRSGDTGLGTFDLGTFGSRLTPSLVPAVRNAGADARRQVLEAASQILSLNLADLYMEDGFIRSNTDPKLKTPLVQVASKFTHVIVGKGFRGPNPSDFRVNSFGAQFAEVEVDTRTGAIKIVKIAAAHDVGRAINPFLLDSQIFGGLGIGRGYATSEERITDRNTGVVPMVPIIIDDVDEHSNNAGVKGMAEPPTIPTLPAIASAVYNATGVMITEFPLTPDRVMKALKAARR
jgi:xanthine dehydrogenase YagR molybdenum-binding subunit